MSTETPPRRHRAQNATMPPATASSQSSLNLQDSQNLLQLNSQAYIQNSQTTMNPNSSFQQPTTPPRTPRKDNQPASQYISSSTAQDPGSKQKSRNKNRPKNVMTSPAAARNGRHASPLAGAQSAGLSSSARPISTPTAAAYAGSTFHASPAPSALPIPSFFSKSVPDSPGLKGLKSLKGAALPTTDSTPTKTTPSAEQLQREESPLDLFFKADREERARSASSARLLASANGPFPPPSESPRNSQTPPSHSSQNCARQENNRLSASGMFAMELDGDRAPGSPLGPAFSTPYAERINAARSGGQLNRSSDQSPEHIQSSLDRSEALKAYLFSGQAPGFTNSAPIYSAPESYQAPFASPSGPRSAGLPNRQQNNGYSPGPDPRMMNGPRPGGRSSNLRQEVTPTKTPTRTPDRNHTSGNLPTPSRNPANNFNHGNNSYASQFASHTTPQAPALAPNAGGSDSTIKGMEDSLRRILKLDPVANS